MSQIRAGQIHIFYFWFALTLLKSDISDRVHFMASMDGR